MADRRISDLTAKGGLEADDDVPIRDGSANYRVAGSVFRTGWHEVQSTKYTATPASTSQLTMSETEDLYEGAPIKWTNAAGTYYSLVHTVTGDTSIDIYGAPFDTGDDLTALYVGRASSVGQIQYHVGSTYGDGVADLLVADNNQPAIWMGPTVYVVGFSVIHQSDDSTTQPKINLKIAGNLLSTADSNNGVQVATTWTANSAVAINTTNYPLTRGDAIEVRCTAAGGTGDASDLSVVMYYVYEGGV